MEWMNGHLCWPICLARGLRWIHRSSQRSDTCTSHLIRTTRQQAAGLAQRTKQVSRPTLHLLSKSAENDTGASYLCWFRGIFTVYKNSSQGDAEYFFVNACHAVWINRFCKEELEFINIIHEVRSMQKKQGSIGSNFNQCLPSTFFLTQWDCWNSLPLNLTKYSNGSASVAH
jgi:hypothetical protein